MNDKTTLFTQHQSRLHESLCERSSSGANDLVVKKQAIPLRPAGKKIDENNSLAIKGGTHAWLRPRPVPCYLCATVLGNAKYMSFKGERSMPANAMAENCIIGTAAQKCRISSFFRITVARHRCTFSLVLGKFLEYVSTLTALTLSLVTTPFSNTKLSKQSKVMWRRKRPTLLAKSCLPRRGSKAARWSLKAGSDLQGDENGTNETLTELRQRICN